MWTEIHGVVGKGTRVDAAATGGRGEDNVEPEGCDVEGSVGDREAVTAHGRGGTVEDGGVTGITVREGPVPIWLRACIATFFLESLFVEPDVVAVPEEKETLIEDYWLA